MDFIHVKIGDDKIKINFTSSLTEFKQQISDFIKREDFTIDFCEDETFDSIEYIKVNTQEEFEYALEKIKQLNRFLRIKISSCTESIESIGSPVNSDISDKSSIEVLYINRFHSNIIHSVVDSPHPISETSSKQSRFSPRQSDNSLTFSSSINTPYFAYNNKAISISKILKKQKKFKEKQSKCEIISQSPIRIEPISIYRIISSGALVKCSNCKILIKSKLKYSINTKSSILCDKCRSKSVHSVEIFELPEKAQHQATVNYFYKMGFTDRKKIEDILLKTNWCYSRTLSSLLGY